MHWWMDGLVEKMATHTAIFYFFPSEALLHVFYSLRSWTSLLIAGVQTHPHIIPGFCLCFLMFLEVFVDVMLVNLFVVVLITVILHGPMPPIAQPVLILVILHDPFPVLL